MMTKEEVAQVIAYCDENKISYKQRLEELGEHRAQNAYRNDDANQRQPYRP